MLRPYQVSAVKEMSARLEDGGRHVLVLPTGAGKTFTFVHLVKATKKRTIVFVHRKSLLNQAVNAFRQSGLLAIPISAETKYIPHADVYVAMIETVFRRMKKPAYFSLLLKCELAIIDECHINNFNKLLDILSCPVMGVTATPAAAGKGALNNVYNSCFVGCQIGQLVDNGWLAEPTTYKAQAVGIGDIAYDKRKGDFDEREQSVLLSKEFSITALIKALSNLDAKNRKVIMFNVSIDHNNAVCNAFRSDGYNVFSVDSSQDKAQNDDAIAGFAKCQHGVMMNVGILTTGYDQPDIDLVVINRKTCSESLWLQMCGRGSRVTPNKTSFDIVYIGDNLEQLGVWEQERDWEYKFNNPKKPKDGVAPIKECPKCHRMVAVKTKECKCGYQFPENSKPAVVVDEMALKKVSVSTNKVNVNVYALYTSLVEHKKRKPHSVTYAIMGKVIALKEDYEASLAMFLELYKELHKMKPDIYKIHAKNADFWKGEFEKQYYGTR